MSVRSRHEVEQTVVRTPRVALSDVREGELARVVGRAVALDELLEAPLTGRPCGYYEITIEREFLGVHTRVAHEVRAVIFALDDGTGRAVIDPSSCIVDLVTDGESTSGYTGPPNQQQQALLTRFEVAETGILELLGTAHRLGWNRPAERHFVYREAIVEVGETIAIVGTAVREPDPDAPPDAAYRGGPGMRLRMNSSRKQPMIICDKPATTR